MDVAANQLSLKSHSISTRRSIDAPIIQKIYPWPEADKSKLIRSLSVACSASPSTNNLQYERLAFRKKFPRKLPVLQERTDTVLCEKNQEWFKSNIDKDKITITIGRAYMHL
ncbi:hypothetical protein TB2_026718 [Malus domestica]